MDRQLKGSVSLPGSKSESNRVLMVAAYGGFSFEMENGKRRTENGKLSEAHDTVLLKQTSLRAERSGAWQSTEEVIIDCEDVGTASRFLMSYLAGKPGTWILTGSPRLRQRPMAPLVEALRQLGADIAYLEAEGCLPVKINGKKLQGGSVLIDASQSSQFVSSLLMAAPTWERGLQLQLKAEAVSMPYVDMTIAIMRHFGAKVERRVDSIEVQPGAYQSKPFVVSPDWSAASYWYEMAALSDDCDLLLEGLTLDSLQGDAVVAEWFKAFGVQSSFEPQGVRLTKSDDSLSQEPLVFDFTMTPDLFPAVFVTCVALHRPTVFRGIQTLSLKESDRVTALVTELLKCYHFDYSINHNEIILNTSSLLHHKIASENIVFDPFGDHRVAMALAGLFLRLGSVSFHHPEVVSKSYPTFWSELQTYF
ncbi:MAG: 3-phosphoshikimate 1-carboxyvinyltransferase [Bacteroidales bacterium]|nr:3-phosphoshikimate 1-carboxyvinyltransferase [Bacteroidales bacterium]MBR4146438.1 3-phosphoshikimate 1-carboxyvinyltransferase [Bacteroidales bacterium]